MTYLDLHPAVRILILFLAWRRYRRRQRDEGGCDEKAKAHEPASQPAELPTRCPDEAQEHARDPDERRLASVIPLGTHSRPKG